MSGKPNMHNNKGLTLVELMITLAIMGFILAGIYFFFSYHQTGYAANDAKAALLQEANLFFGQLEKDVRSASRPNKDTKAVVTTGAGLVMDIYTVDRSTGKYIQIKYRYYQKKIQRAWVECAQALPPASGANPSYGAVVDDAADYMSGAGGKWKTVLSNVDDSASPLVIFQDISSNPAGERRKIKVQVALKPQDRPADTPVTFESVYTSRSKGLPGS